MKKKSYALITLAILLVACSQALANFTGGDNFNDISMDAGKWEIFNYDPGSSLIETNGHLEFISAATDAFAARKWILNGGSYTQDWSMTYDIVNTFNPSNMVDSQTWVGMFCFFGSGDNSFGTELTVGNDAGGPFKGLLTNIRSGGATLTNVINYVEEGAYTMRVTFDSITKKIHIGYDAGAGFFQIAEGDISGWGMTAGDDFSIYLSSETRNMAVTSGQIYGDNFILSSGSVIPPNEEARIYCSSIVGSWIQGDPTTKDSVMITFLTNGTYFLAHDGMPDGHGQPGMERGTYDWNENTEAFTHTTTVDTCGEWGLSNTTPNDTVAIDGDTLYLTVPDEGTFPFQRVSYPTTPPSIVGGWVHLDPVNNHDNIAFVFLPNGIYFFAQDGDPAFDPGGQDGMERGIYTWNAGSDAFSAMALVDTCGAWGPDGVTSASVDGNMLTLNGSFVLTRVVDPQCSDLDGDGLPDMWEQQYFSNPTIATASGHGDSDALNNRAEYVAGTIPTSGSSVFEVSNPWKTPSGYVIDWASVSGRVYTVEWTDHLTNSFQTLETDITHPQNSYTDTTHNAESGGFYNLKVELGN